MKTPFNFDTKVLIMMYLEDLPAVHVETRNYERPYIHVKPRYNEGPRDSQGSRFFLKYLAIIGVKKIVRYTEDFVTAVRSIEVSLKSPLYYAYLVL